MEPGNGPLKSPGKADSFLEVIIIRFYLKFHGKLIWAPSSVMVAKTEASPWQALTCNHMHQDTNQL